jgi:hypothetical protein
VDSMEGFVVTVLCLFDLEICIKSHFSISGKYNIS